MFKEEASATHTVVLLDPQLSLCNLVGYSFTEEQFLILRGISLFWYCWKVLSACVCRENKCFFLAFFGLIRVIISRRDRYSAECIWANLITGFIHSGVIELWLSVLLHLGMLPKMVGVLVISSWNHEASIHFRIFNWEHKTFFFSIMARFIESNFLLRRRMVGQYCSAFWPSRTEAWTSRASSNASIYHKQVQELLWISK